MGDTDATATEEKINRLTEIFKEVNDGACVTVEEQRESARLVSSGDTDEENDYTLTDALDDGLDDAVSGSDARQMSGGN